MIVRYRKAVDPRLPSLGPRARLRFVGINQANSDAVMEISSRAQMTKALLIFLIMISPAVTDDQNVTDFDPLKFRLE